MRWSGGRLIYEQYNKLDDADHDSRNSPEYKIRRYEFLENMQPFAPRQWKSRFGGGTWRRTQEHKAMSFGINLNRNADISQLLIEYEPIKEEYELYNNRHAIKAKYFSLQQSVGCVTHQTKLFNNRPTYFMKQYIESTHNMFLIQEKRINELGEKIRTQVII